MKLIKRVIAILTERQRKLLVFMLLMMLVGAGLETAGTSLLIPFITIAMEPDSVFQNEYLKYFYDLMHLCTIPFYLQRSVQYFQKPVQRLCAAPI